jgi:magnesium-transporting ATPase (P-type)
MSFLSLIGIHDPPRPGVARAVADLQQSHVAVVMITGDALVTASTIGTQARKHILHTYFTHTLHVLCMYCTCTAHGRDGRETGREILEYRCDVLLS